ncbi:unnamed protein product [Durusdinium trenchii]|uniref:Uncharacterized protein n=1 Tax=Durusdinium trenchii TaxID=1381693 RepID=A0ABP0R3S2_9DINO
MQPSRPPLRAPVLRHALPRPSVARRAKACVAGSSRDLREHLLLAAAGCCLGRGAFKDAWKSLDDPSKSFEALFPERSRRASESLAPQRPVALLDSQLRSAPSPQALRRALRQAQEKRWLNGALVATAAQRCGEARWWEQLVEVIEASRGLSLSPAQQRTVLLALASAGHGRGSEVLRLAVEVWTPPVDTLEDGKSMVSAAFKLCRALGTEQAALLWADQLWDWARRVLPPEAWSSGTLPEQRLGLLELQQRYEEVDAMVRTLTPTAWLLRNLLSADATLRDWQRADELWAQMARAAPADGLAYAAYAKVHLLCGRPGAGLEILDQIMHGVHEEDTYLDAQYAIDYLQMLLVVCHSHTDAVNLQRLRGSFLVSLSNSRGLQRHWDRLEALGHQLLATPYRAATVKDLLVTRAAQESVMKDWDFAPNSGYLWDFAAPSGKREAENAQKTGDKKVETRREVNVDEEPGVHGFGFSEVLDKAHVAEHSERSGFGDRPAFLYPTGGFEAECFERSRRWEQPSRNPGTWGLVGGMLSPEERWIYRSNGLPEWLWKRVLRRAALREALEEMGGSESDLAKAKIIFEPLCVQVTQDGQVVRLGRKVVEAVVPAGLTFMEVDEQRSRPLRIGSSHTFVFVYVIDGLRDGVGFLDDQWRPREPPQWGEVDESQGVFGYEWRPLSYIDEASAACHLHPVVRLLQAADVRAAADALAEGSRVVPSIAWRDGSVQMLQMMATAAETKSWLGQRDGSGCSLSSCEGMEKAVEALQYFKEEQGPLEYHDGELWGGRVGPMLRLCAAAVERNGSVWADWTDASKHSLQDWENWDFDGSGQQSWMKARGQVLRNLLADAGSADAAATAPGDAPGADERGRRWRRA